LLENIADSREEESVEVVRILKAEDEALLKEPSKKLCPGNCEADVGWCLLDTPKAGMSR